MRNGEDCGGTVKEMGFRPRSEAFIRAISVHLPETVVTNLQLQEENADWDMAKIEAKVGIKARHVAPPEVTAGDLAYFAARSLFESSDVDRNSIDFLLFCTQSPDYFLPATACILQDRLRLGTHCAALDFNQGCSGYVYGLRLAESLVAAGNAKRVLFLTGETYSKYIHSRDRSVRVLFGDGATATLIDDTGPGARILAGCLGSDGSGAENLIVRSGGMRSRRSSGEVPIETGQHESVGQLETLFMDGQELFQFTLRRIPPLVEATAKLNNVALEEVDWFVFHQANVFMNEHIRRKLKIPQEKAPIVLEDVGNTVSNTIPIAIHRLGDQFRPGQKLMLVGFGVGYSWGACMLEWQPIHRA
ncbi:MAG TPA: ketoacyl-ACP synthase III [Candidatus Acidoferrum sp.]|jgi:3-oxoacyl-[acyl-carrier-protein] synthase-3